MMDMVAHAPTKWNDRPDRLWLVGGVHDGSNSDDVSSAEVRLYLKESLISLQ